MSTPPQKLYLFSGLGADERVFQLLDLEGLDCQFVKWIPPLRHESLAQYATRMRGQIGEPDPVLVGLSFGGMVAVEVAKQMPAARVILLASAKTRAELPIYLRWAGRLNLHKLVPTQLLKSANRLSYWLFGARTQAERSLLRTILAETDARFLRWAIAQVAKWGNTIVVPHLWHIHGTADRVLPIAFVNCHCAIAGAGHLLPLAQPQAVSEAIRRHLR
jgi:pimeloyl-ACP methyl ester carboxylesterase